MRSEQLQSSLDPLQVSEIFPQLGLPTSANMSKVHPSLDSMFRAYQQDRGFNGAVLLAERGQVIHSGAYGYRNLLRKDTLKLSTPFQLASVSKVYTATAILMLYEQGLLGLDDPVVMHLPTFPYPAITIRHLLCHRSGLSRYMGLGDQYWDKKKYMRNEDVLQLLVTHHPILWAKPGKKFNYINTNYAMLALLVERVSGLSFDTYLKERIFEPLGLHETYVCTYQDRKEMEQVAIGYNRVRRRPRDAQGDYIDGVFGDKGVYASAQDLFRFEQALSQGAIISPASLLLAYQPGSPERKINNYGFGWRMRSYYPDLVYHFGWWRGYRSCLIRDLQAERTLIILSNQDSPRHAIPYWSVFHFFNQSVSDSPTPFTPEIQDAEAEEENSEPSEDWTS